VTRCRLKDYVLVMNKTCLTGTTLLYYQELIDLYGPRLTRRQAMQALACSYSKIQRLEQAGTLLALRVGTNVVYNASQVAEILTDAMTA
jgi:hypothetical protein